MILFPEQINRILGSGGGMKIKAVGNTPDQLCQYAGFAKGGNARLTIDVRGAIFTPDDLAKIAGFGQGAVVFEGLFD